MASAEADAVRGSLRDGPHRARPGRNVYRHRDFDTRVGTLDIALPQLRPGSQMTEDLDVHVVLGPEAEPDGRV